MASSIHLGNPVKALHNIYVLSNSFNREQNNIIPVPMDVALATLNYPGREETVNNIKNIFNGNVGDSFARHIKLRTIGLWFFGSKR